MITTTFPCEVGDVTLGWEASNDEDVRTIIQKKLDEGFVFFIAPSDHPEQHLRVRKFEQIGDRRQVIIPDRDFHELFVEGKIVVVGQPITSDTARPVAGPERARTADAVMANNTVAHRGHVAG